MLNSNNDTINSSTSIITDNNYAGIRNISSSQLIFDLGLVSYIIFFLMEYSTLGNEMIKNFFIYSFILFMGVHLFVEKYSKKGIFFTIAVCLIAIIAYLTTNSRNLAFSLLIIGLSKGINIKKSLKTAAITYSILIFAIVLLSQTGILIDNISVQSRNYIFGGIRTVTRHSFGFIHPNALMIVCMQVISMWIYFRYNKLKIIEYAGIIGLSWYIYTVTGSRAPFYSILLLLFLVPNIKLLSSKKYTKRIISIFIAMPILFAAFSYIFSRMYYSGNPIVSVLNILSHQRIKLQAYVINQYGISLFPRSLQFTTINGSWVNATVLDNGYMRLLVNYGIIIFAVVIWMYTVALYYFYKREEYEKMLLLLVGCFLGLSENSLFILGYNLPMLFLPEMIFDNKKGTLLRNHVLKNVFTRR